MLSIKPWQRGRVVFYIFFFAALRLCVQKNTKIEAEIETGQKQNVDLREKIRITRSELQEEQTASAEIREQLSILTTRLDKEKSDLMDLTGELQNTLGGSGLTRVHVGKNTNISVTSEVCHFFFLVIPSEQDGG